MKKLLLLLFILACFTTLTACNNGSILDNNSPYFTGKVLEIYENGCLVEVTDTGNGNFEIGSNVHIHTNISSCPDFDMGDYLKIIFDGKVAYSYPPQIPNVYSISKLES